MIATVKPLTISKIAFRTITTQKAILKLILLSMSASKTKKS